MKTAGLFLSFFLGLACTGTAQNLVLKDGRVAATMGIRRNGDAVLAMMEVPSPVPGQPAGKAELSFPLALIDRIDFPLPEELSKVPELIEQGKIAEALTMAKALMDLHEAFRDTPGNRWESAALLTAQVMGSQERILEAQALALKLAGAATDPEMVRAANVEVAAGHLKLGARDKALQIIEPILKESRASGPLAGASVIKGECLLAEAKWEEALLAFLQVPVFYPQERLQLPLALLGRGRSHLGMDDLPAARAALEQLQTAYPASPAAKLAKTHLENIAEREKAIVDSK